MKLIILIVTSVMHLHLLVDCCRPEENVEPVEVSAYDLKDHPDFKFRPAQTVIRVTEIQVGHPDFKFWLAQTVIRVTEVQVGYRNQILTGADNDQNNESRSRLQKSYSNQLRQWLEFLWGTFRIIIDLNEWLCTFTCIGQWLITTQILQHYNAIIWFQCVVYWNFYAPP
jgi:hypothetical protein